MPIHVPPISRRSFLSRSAAAAIAVTCGRSVFAAETDVDSDFIALLSDTHIPSDPATTARGVNMTDHLAGTVKTLVTLKRRPAAVLINGDCAYLKGLPKDYENFATLVRPLSEAGLPLHLTMGNHDARGPLYDAIAALRPAAPPVESKHVSVVSTPHADWILLDSLMETDVVTGELGAAQLKWLKSMLSAGGEKPAIVMAHHNPQFEPPAEGKVWGGLKDTNVLFDLLESQPRVKAFVYGHSHNWSIDRRGRLHLVNLPPVAYVFAEGKPNGWVEARTRKGGLDLRLNTHDDQHPQNGETVSLAWS
ncbi:MAG: metallophosphoesterase [Planctomycetaceae bacterium]